MAEVLNSTLAHLLDEQISGLSLLVETLTKEKEALAKRDSTQIETINQTKQMQVATLQASSQTLHDLLATLSSTRDLNQQKDWLSKHLGNHPLWQQWTSLAAECKMLNEQNGKLIEANLKLQEQQLNILLPQANTTKLYTATGISEDKTALTRSRDIV